MKGRRAKTPRAISNRYRDAPQIIVSMNENDSSQERDVWADTHFREVNLRKLPWEHPPYRQGAEEPLSIPAVFYALMAIRKGKSREQKSGSLQRSSAEYFNPANWEDVNRPPDDAVRIITRALQAGAKGEKMIKNALELKSRAKGTILARHIARKLTKPKGGWPKNEENWDQFNFDTVEWVKPSKQEVERELERLYPEIYKKIPKKDGNGGPLLRSDFWDEAGLKEAIGQARGN